MTYDSHCEYSSAAMLIIKPTTSDYGMSENGPGKEHPESCILGMSSKYLPLQMFLHCVEGTQMKGRLIILY